MENNFYTGVFNKLKAFEPRYGVVCECSINSSLALCSSKKLSDEKMKIVCNKFI